MILAKKENFKIVLGCNPFDVLKEKPFRIFSDLILEFLSEFSKNCLKKYKNQINFKEFIGFTFWCRSANLRRLKNDYHKLDYRYGRGGSFHITPNNVPANILFSMAFGLLTGNPTVLRVSNNSLESLRFIFHELELLLGNKKYKDLEKYISIISYSRDEEINENLSINSSSRLIWGGDKTINNFKNYKTKIGCIDLTFPDKKSTAIIDLESLEQISNENRNKLIENFSRDIATFSQKACSSPFFIFTLERSENKMGMKILESFFLDIDKFLTKKFSLEIPSRENFKSSINLIVKGKNLIETLYKGNKLYVGKVHKKNIHNFYDFHQEFACLCVVELTSINEISKYLVNNNQTVILFPFEEKIIKEIIPIIGPLGSNRIVKIGDALNMNLYWDGYDIVSSLSKFIRTS